MNLEKLIADLVRENQFARYHDHTVRLSNEFMDELLLPTLRSFLPKPEHRDVYDKVSERLDRINDLVQGKLSDQEMGELLRLEAEILHEVTFA